ncbi:hypothetical protein AALP_AA5G132700 [Arabis alpina]|nr:hypothetical protein AALP_AA5G132700 [Arabis alpina]
MWFPIPRLVLEYCEARLVAPSQLTCASYRNICVILTMTAELGRSVSLAQLEEMVGIAKSGDCGRFYASMKSGNMILTGISSRIERWKNKYFFVRINKFSVGDFTGVIRAGWISRIERKLQVLEPVPKGAFSLIEALKKLGKQRWGDFIEQRIRRCRRRVTTGSIGVPVHSDARRRDKGIVIENPSKEKVGGDTSMKPTGALETVGDRGVRRSEKRRDRDDVRGHSSSDPKRNNKEDRRKDKAPVVSEVAVAGGPNPEEQVAEELVGDRTASGATLSFGNDYDFDLQFHGRGRHILEDPVACGEYVHCIQGHPRGPIPASEEMVERDGFLAFSVDLTRMVSNVNFMRTRYERMLQKNHELIMENRSLKSRMKNMTIAAEERVGRINALEQKNKELKVEVAKWEDEVRSMMGEKESIYHLAKSQMKRLRISRRDTAMNFGEYAVEKVGTELQERVEAKFEKIRRHIADSKKMNHISSTVGQIKAFLSFYEEQGSAPDGAVERLQEDLEKYLKMAVAHHVEKISEEEFTFPDRASWIPGEELIFPVETPNKIGQYGLGEEVGGSDPIVSPRGRERRSGFGSSHVSETDEEEGPLGVDGRTENVEHPPEVAGASTRAAEGPSTVADPARGPNVTTEVPGIDDVDVVNF